MCCGVGCGCSGVVGVLHGCDVGVGWDWGWIVDLQRWSIVVLKCVGAVGLLGVRFCVEKEKKRSKAVLHVANNGSGRFGPDVQKVTVQ